MQFISFRDCMGIDAPDRYYHEQNMNQANIGLLGLWRSLGNTGDLPVGWNGPGGNPNATTAPAGMNTSQIIDTAKQLQQFQIEANKPVVTALQGQQPKLEEQYKSLVDSIKGNQQVAANSATLNANNELARRGISGGGLYDKTLTDAVLPVNAAYSGQIANAMAGSVGDLNALALKIAQAQAGDPLASINFSTNIAGQQQDASQFAQQLAQNMFLGTYQSPFNQAQTSYYNALASAGNNLGKKSLSDIFS